MKSPPRARSPTLLRILLDSGFGAKCGAPHFAPLLPNTQPLRVHLRSLLDVLLQQKVRCTILDPAEINDELRALCEALIASNKTLLCRREETQAVSEAIKWLMAKYPHALRQALDNGFFGSLDEKRR